MPPTPSLVPRTNTTPSAVYRVFHTTELLETILLDENIHMLDLFTFQRVNHKFQDVIQGSSKLRVKMFLDYSTEYDGIEDAKTIEWWERNGLIPRLFNPLAGYHRNGTPSPARHSLGHRTQMAVFRQYNIIIHPIGGLGKSYWDIGIMLSRSQPSGSVPKKLEPRLQGSWRALHIAKVPVEVLFNSPSYRFVIDGTSTMGDFVDHLLRFHKIDRKLRREMATRPPFGSVRIRFA